MPTLPVSAKIGSPPRANTASPIRTYERALPRRQEKRSAPGVTHALQQPSFLLAAMQRKHKRDARAKSSTAPTGGKHTQATTDGTIRQSKSKQESKRKRKGQEKCGKTQGRRQRVAERKPKDQRTLRDSSVWLLLGWRGPRAPRSIAPGREPDKTGSKEAANHLRGGAAAPSRRAPPRRRRPMVRHCRDHRHGHTADTDAWKVASPGVAAVIRARRLSRGPGDDRGATSVLPRPGPVTEVSGRGIVGPGPGADRRRKEATRLAAPSDVAAAGSELIDDDRHTHSPREGKTRRAEKYCGSAGN